MKTKKLWFVVVLGIMLPFVFTSCQKEEPIDDPNNPPAVDYSDITDMGIGSVSASNTADGSIALSYESWVLAYQEYANGKKESNKISYLVRDTLCAASEDIEVWSYDLLEYDTGSRTEELGWSKEGYITVYDSVLIYTVKYLGLSFDYMLYYKVPVYDDGVNKEVMPHHTIGKITCENNPDLRDGDPKEIDGAAYAVKYLRHSIKVQFGDKEYEVKAEIPLIRKIAEPGEKYIVKSELVNKEYSPLSGTDEVGFSSTINVKQTWSDGTVTNQSKSVDLYYSAQNVVGDEISVNGQPEYLAYEAITVEADEMDIYGSDELAKVWLHIDKVNVKYNYFTLTIPFRRMTAQYDDVLLQEDFMSFEYAEGQINITNTDIYFVERTGNSEYYQIHIDVEADVQGVKVVGSYDCSVVFNH
jgi:hypothetical protein